MTNLALAKGLARVSKESIVLIVLIWGYVAYDALCFILSNSVGFLSAVALTTGILIVLSVFLVIVHEYTADVYGWDILGLRELNSYRTVPVAGGFYKRWLGWVMKKGSWWIYFIGPWTVGPFAVALLLRSSQTWGENLKYILPGSLLSAVFWTVVWKGLGALIWDQYIIPLFRIIQHLL